MFTARKDMKKKHSEQFESPVQNFWLRHCYCLRYFRNASAKWGFTNPLPSIFWLIDTDFNTNAEGGFTPPPVKRFG